MSTKFNTMSALVPMAFVSLNPSFNPRPPSLFNKFLESHRQAETKVELLRISRRYLTSCEARKTECTTFIPSLWPPTNAIALLKSLPPSKHFLPSLAFSILNPVSRLQDSETGHDASDRKPSEPSSVSRRDPQDNVSSSADAGAVGPSSEAHSITHSRGGQDPDEDPPAEDVHGEIRRFSLYNQPKSIRETNEAIKAELLKAHPATEGFIYGFVYPGNVPVRIGSGPIANSQLIKIGRSMDVKRRMKEWRKQCKYEPRVVLEVRMPHHFRIERIIHHQLHNSRLREYPGCSGCGFQHNEWFRVSTVYAEHIVRMWHDFAQRQPYDEFGDLLPGWLERLEQVDLEDPGCWMWFILESALVGPMSALDNSIAKLDDSQSMLPNPSSDVDADESIQ